MGSETLPDPDATQNGVFRFQRLPDDSGIKNVVSKDLRAPGAYPFPYSELEEGIPGVSMDQDLGRRVPAPSGARDQQALSACPRHDGMGDKVLIMNPSGNNSGLPEDHPEYMCFPFMPKGAPPKMMSPDHRGQVFYFSPESLKALKAETSQGNASRPSDQSWISTNDALSALLWRTVMAVQDPLESLEGDLVSVFSIAIDGRLRTCPPMHRDTLGCFLEYIAVSAPIRQMLGSSKLADLALLILKALIRADKQFTDDVVTLVEKLDHVDKIVATAFMDVPGHHCLCPRL
ncbi:hypothetical protein EDB80DRAFT_774203 [Ilyonectria destructans]|nr:hypothetical protein EDB80DRAFT_774203 [Ilyonectria destructans]